MASRILSLGLLLSMLVALEVPAAVMPPGAGSLRKPPALLRKKLIQLAQQQAQRLEKDKPAAEDVTELSMQVDALQMFYLLDMTPAQLRSLAKLAQDTDSTRVRQPSKVSAAYRATLLALRTALIKGDDTQVDDLIEKLDGLREKETVQIDDKIDLTPAAKQKARSALRLLGARQVMDYLKSIYEDEVPDPLERIADTAERGVTAQGAAWTKLRDEAAEEVGGWVAGFDADKARKVREGVTVLLDKAHVLTEAELKKNRSMLEQGVQEIMGDVGPLEVVRNVVERDLAELLANPQLRASLEAMSKEGK